MTDALEADQQVMSTNQYAACYRINPATAAKAFQQLIDDGVLFKRRGIGMFVSPDARRGRGAEVTGPADMVDLFVTGLRVLSERRLGPTKAAVGVVLGTGFGAQYMSIPLAGDWASPDDFPLAAGSAIAVACIAAGAAAMWALARNVAVRTSGGWHQRTGR